jgi:hypothetical protein
MLRHPFALALGLVLALPPFAAAVERMVLMEKFSNTS